ncbi:MAG: hypothetical protein EOO62_23520 [Hymenobacter sp.]|nr:MAG: hypothetical protein EOO62_23520 [Hymenobacter sp.]
MPLELLVATELANTPVALPATSVLPAAVPRYEPTEAAQVPDLEADLQPNEADELASSNLTTSILSENSFIAQPAPRPAAQADWAEALATLRQPARSPEPVALPDPTPEVEPTTAAAAPVAHPALRPAATHYPAPDLNFQIIQYARFAVPVALAEPPFAVVYAPAWPTWLAAQELRQRTGHPLVLHVSTLAAAEDDSVETATGWIAELQRQALRRADLLLAETPALAQRLRNGLRIGSRRCTRHNYAYPAVRWARAICRELPLN